MWPYRFIQHSSVALPICMRIIIDAGFPRPPQRSNSDLLRSVGRRVIQRGKMRGCRNGFHFYTPRHPPPFVEMVEPHSSKLRPVRSSDTANFSNAGRFNISNYGNDSDLFTLCRWELVPDRTERHINWGKTAYLICCGRGDCAHHCFSPPSPSSRTKLVSYSLATQLKQRGKRRFVGDGASAPTRGPFSRQF